MSASAVESARSMLFVPGDRPQRFERAMGSGADVVVIDLENAVAPETKSTARRNVLDLLGTSPEAVVVRVNDPRTDVGAADLDGLAGVRSAVTVMVPKAEDPVALVAARQQLGTGGPMVPLIETALGVQRADEIAGTPGVVRLALGHLDLAAELGISPDDDRRLWPARFAVVLASASAGLASPVDGVSTATRDDRRTRDDALRSSADGFTGKLCVHPDQIAPVHEAFAPTELEIAWAHRVEEALRDHPVAVVDGSMVDRPVLLRARSVLARAGLWRRDP